MGRDEEAESSSRVTSARTVVRSSLADQVTEALRDMILIGQYPPGQKLTHEELARDLGVSTMPVREALLRLTHEGFITFRPNRNFEVASTTRSDIEDIYWAHAMIAGELTARACRNADPEFLKSLKAVQDQFEASPPGASEDLCRLNHEFHRLINRQSGSPKLLLLLRNTVRLIPERFYSLLPEWRDVSYYGHKEIIDSIEEANPWRSQSAAASHVREAGALVAEYFSDKGYWAAPPQMATEG